MDENRARADQISLAKLNNVKEAIKIARIARDILGARGILADHQIIRHLCDLEAISALEGTASMHTLLIGKARITSYNVCYTKLLRKNESGTPLMQKLPFLRKKTYMMF